MRYETFLFTRNQRQDFTAFIRPAQLTNRDVSAIGATFNYVNDISRLTPEFPSLYCFPLGSYILLLRHYNSGRTHAGRAIAVIEGIAVQQAESAELAQCVAEQHSLLNASGAVGDIEQQRPQVAVEQEWRGRPLRKPTGEFVGAFLERRDDDRLFLPFSAIGLDMLTTALADRRFSTPPFFAFGTNSDVLAQFEQRGAVIDIVSFLNTDRPCFRSRATNRLSGSIDGYDLPPDPSMSLRGAPHSDINLRPHTEQPSKTLADDEDTVIGDDAVSLRSQINRPQPPRPIETDDTEQPAVLTLRQMRDKIHAEEQAASAADQQPDRPRDPIHWLIKLLSSLISPSKPK